MLGQGGDFAEPTRRLWHQPLYFAIPSGLLRPGGNLLQIHLHTDPPRNGWLGRLHLGPASGLCIMMFALRDWLAIAGIIVQRGEGLFIQYAAPVPILGFGWLLLRDFVRARNEAEALNRELEQRVREKSAELEQNYQRLRELERQRVLDEERRRIMRDMHDGMGGHLISTLALAESGAAQSATIAEALHGVERFTVDDRFAGPRRRRSHPGARHVSRTAGKPESGSSRPRKCRSLCAPCGSRWFRCLRPWAD
ncbi:MAG: hypothetical protein EA420_06610 [Candidatus Competibacteraceae bacterium]|nr:MAG: hypothetical protein EA420_06610 [Candidatus Competibacteraceae bacterium]